jgi:hypothetical protein
MCAECVAQSTPIVAVGFGLLRRQALGAWVRTFVLRRPVPERASAEPPVPAAR